VLAGRTGSLSSRGPLLVAAVALALVMVVLFAVVRIQPAAAYRGEFSRGPLISAAGQASCTTAQKANRQAALRAYRKRMIAQRREYFRAHPSVKLRSAFVKSQRARLKELQAAAACTVPPPAPPIDTGPLPAPPPGPNELFNFDSGIAAVDQEEIKGDVAYAVQNEAVLLGVPVGSVRVFTSNSPDWLADQECRALQLRDDNCVQHVRQRYASGGSTGEAGPGAFFLYWPAPSWRYGAAENQKIIAHELHHVFQYQLDKVSPNSGDDSQVPPSGPVWLSEGSAEMVGYRVAVDRRLFPSYSSVLVSQISRAKQISAPLSSLEKRVDVNIPDVYTLFHVAVDHLVSITPAGLPALTAYLNGIGAGMAWQDAFRAAFGMSIEAYYASFAAYRAGL
jgi:hypothetical protein